MKRLMMMVAVAAVLAFAGSAYATGEKVTEKVNDHTCQGNANCSTNNTTNNTTNNNTTNQGGQGGAGGSATSKATATGGNATATGGNATSNATGGSVKNSGNSSSSSSAKQSQKQGQAQAQGQNNNQTISVQNGGGEKSIGYAAPPSMGVASLVAAPETCMGSTSASLSGGNGIVGAGIGFGKTYESANCNRRMNARYLLTMGQPEAALALLAQDDDVRKALEDAGVEVPNKRAEKAAAEKQVKLSGGTDRAAVGAGDTFSDKIGVTPKDNPRTGPGANDTQGN